MQDRTNENRNITEIRDKKGKNDDKIIEIQVFVQTMKKQGKRNQRTNLPYEQNLFLKWNKHFMDSWHDILLKFSSCLMLITRILQVIASSKPRFLWFRCITNFCVETDCKKGCLASGEMDIKFYDLIFTTQSLLSLPMFCQEGWISCL